MRLSRRDIAILTGFPCFIAMGQMLFKLTAAHARGRPLVDALGVFVAQPVFYAALFVYVAGTLLWIWILSRYSLAIAYPFAAITLVAVPSFEALFFGVTTSPPYWIGLGLIVAGVLIITRAQVAEPQG